MFVLRPQVIYVISSTYVPVRENWFKDSKLKTSVQNQAAVFMAIAKKIQFAPEHKFLYSSFLLISAYLYILR